ncbi:MAG: hypothetical protein CM15mP62_23890 [Rhodospirillaceae bacterium]|nr:MAG: hypothetical protein CM15mP62_23890 [Rhodospirillaceae bacterium]
MVNPIIFGCEGLALTPSERSFFKGFPPMGFILFKRNCNTKTQVISLINSLRDTGWRESTNLDRSRRREGSKVISTYMERISASGSIWAYF